MECSLSRKYKSELETIPCNQCGILDQSFIDESSTSNESSLLIKNGGFHKIFFLLCVFYSVRPEEILMKGKSIDYMLKRIARYSDGCIVTNKEGICL